MPRPTGASTFASNARREATEILSRAPFAQRRSSFPNPVARALNEIGRAVVWLVGTPARWLWNHLGSPSFRFLHASLGAGFWVVVAAVAVAAGGFLATLLIRRRSRAETRRDLDAPEGGKDESRELLRAIARAEAEGQNDQVVRLRFQLGLARLQAQGVILNRLTLTSDELRRILCSPIFDELAAGHEAVAYAEQPASTLDAFKAREGWDRLLGDIRASRHGGGVRNQQ